MYERTILAGAFAVAAFIGLLLYLMPASEPETPTAVCNELNSGPRPDGEGWQPMVHPSGEGCAWGIK
jgi:hypothetical protein